MGAICPKPCPPATVINPPVTPINMSAVRDSKAESAVFINDYSRIETNCAEEFIESCMEGNLEKAMKLYEENVFLTNILEQGLYRAAMKDRVEIVDWLYEIFDKKHLEFLSYIINDIFVKLCSKNRFVMAKHFMKFGKITTKSLKEGFVYACKYGQKEIAEWLYAYDCSVITSIDDMIFTHHVCYSRNYEVIKWLSGIREFRISGPTFINICRQGPLDLVTHLYSSLDVSVDKSEAFLAAAYGDQFEIMKWLYSQGGVDIHYRNDLVFREICYKDSLTVAKWIYSLDSISFDRIGEIFIENLCRLNRINILKWLYSLREIRNNTDIDSILKKHGITFSS